MIVRREGLFESVESNLEQENPDPVVLDRFPEEDYEDLPFTENAEFVMSLWGVMTSFACQREPALNTARRSAASPMCLRFVSRSRRIGGKG